MTAQNPDAPESKTPEPQQRWDPEQYRAEMMEALKALTESGQDLPHHKQMMQKPDEDLILSGSGQQISPVSPEVDPVRMAQEMGVALEDLAGELKYRINALTEAMAEMQRRLGTRPNRKQRRDTKFGRNGAPRIKNGRVV